MIISDLKELVEQNRLDLNLSYIFLYKKNYFLCKQYIDEILKYHDVIYLNDLNQISVKSPFSSDKINVIYLSEIKNFDFKNLQPTIVVTSKAKNVSNVEIVEFPDIEKWQINDYVYSKLSGIDLKDLDWLISICNYDIFRIENEINKLIIFPEKIRQQKFNNFLQDSIFSDLTNKNIFNFSNAIFNRDINELSSIYKIINYCDIEPLGLVTIIYNNLRKMIEIGFSKNPESLGYKQNQIYAVKKLVSKYSSEKILKAFDFICDIEYNLKRGVLPEYLIVDYVTLNILSILS